MIEYTSTLSANSFAIAYGEGTFNSNIYSAQTDTAAPTTPGTTVPGAPNTGFFSTTFSGASELSLIPILLILAIGIGAIAVVVRRLVRRRAHHHTSN